MKRNSRSLIMLCVSEFSRASRGQIVKHTGLSSTHVYEVVDGLIAEGELIETGSVSSGRGRPTVFLEVNPNSTSAGGVWLAENSIEVGVAGATGKVIARESLSYSGDPLKDIDSIVEALTACAEESHKSLETLHGVGVMVAGYVAPGLGTIVATTHDNGFAGVPIVKLLQKRVGMPVYADIDIRAAALADQWRNAKNERVLYVSFCDGVGAAFVNDREIFGKETGLAPTLGHITIHRNGPQCECGRRGCLDAYTSNYAFVRNVWPDVDARQLAPGQLHEMVKQGVDLAVQGDYDAVAAVSKIAENIGLGISIAVNILDVQTVYVGGTVISYMPDVMMNMIRRESVRLIGSAFQGVEIKPLVTLQEFELKGACGLVLLNQFRSHNQDISAKLMFPYSPNAAASSEELYEPVIVHNESRTRGVSQNVGA